MLSRYKAVSPFSERWRTYVQFLTGVEIWVGSSFSWSVPSRTFHLSSLWSFRSAVCLRFLSLSLQPFAWSKKSDKVFSILTLLTFLHLQQTACRETERVGVQDSLRRACSGSTLHDCTRWQISFSTSWPTFPHFTIVLLFSLSQCTAHTVFYSNHRCGQGEFRCACSTWWVFIQLQLVEVVF